MTAPVITQKLGLVDQRMCMPKHVSNSVLADMKQLTVAVPPSLSKSNVYQQSCANMILSMMLLQHAATHALPTPLAASNGHFAVLPRPSYLGLASQMRHQHRRLQQCLLLMGDWQRWPAADQGWHALGQMARRLHCCLSQSGSRWRPEDLPGAAHAALETDLAVRRPAACRHICYE